MAETTFFRIYPPNGEDSRQWADRFWDTYGFDYDTEHCHDAVVAWPLDDSEFDFPESGNPVEGLKVMLEEDGIRYSTFEVDPDIWFGLTDQR